MICPKCGKENPNGSRFCESCGEKLLMTCPKCGKDVELTTTFCPYCGCDLRNEVSSEVGRTESQPANPSVSAVAAKPAEQKLTGLQVAALVFLILSCVGFGLSALVTVLCIFGTLDIFAESDLPSSFFIFPLILLLVLVVLSLVFTIIVAKKLNSGHKISVGLGVCVLLFSSLVAGILLLVDSNKK